MLLPAGRTTGASGTLRGRMDAQTAIWIVASGLGTAAGGALILLLRTPREGVMNALLGLTAGIMLAATGFSLLVPALDRGPLAQVSVGFLLGGLVMLVLDEWVPHIHARFRENHHQTLEEAAAERRGLLLLSALTIHNVPEGMAVGLAFAAGGTDLGIPLALAIGLQNIPEGFAAAAPLRDAGSTARFAAIIGGATGLVEPVAGFAAYFAFDLVEDLLAGGLAFAAGAMLYVIVDELIPEAHGRGNEREVTIALMGGFTVMMILDNALG